MNGHSSLPPFSARANDADAANAGSQTKSRRGYAGITSGARDAQRRERLIHAGIERFGAEGYAASTIESLCTAAQVSTRDFYSYFAAKEDLLLSVYDRIIEETLTAVDAAVATAGDDPAAASLAGLHAFAAELVRDERRARINFIEIVGVSARAELRRRRAIRSFVDRIRRFAEPLAAAGVIDGGIITDVRGVGLAGAVHEVLTDWLLGDERPPLDDVVGELAALFVSAMRG